MGNGVSQKRYMGGKIVPKFYTEDIWPNLAQLLEKLDISEKRGLELFKAFALIDKDENGLVDVDEIFDYLHGTRTLFTERIFYHEEYNNGRVEKGLNFKDFIVVFWNYCSLTTEGLARYVYEIFDVDNQNYLERVDVETMYKMLYDTDDYDERIINYYSFDLDSRISKDEFLLTSISFKKLIRPALDYQKIIRKKIGGIVLWELIAKYRRNAFASYEKQAPTLSAALVLILRSKSKNYKKYMQVSPDDILEQQKEKLLMDQESVEMELKSRNEMLDREKKLKLKTAEDRAMKKAWKEYDRKKSIFAETEFTLDDVWIRREMREELYQLIEVAIAETIKYYEWKDKHDAELVEGTDDDHEARYQDYLATEKGKLHYQFLLLHYVFEFLYRQTQIVKLSKFQKKKKKKKKGGLRGESEKKEEKEVKKTQKEIVFEGFHDDLKYKYSGLYEEGITEEVKKKRWKHLQEHDFSDEIKAMRKYGKRSDIQAIEIKVHKVLSEELKAQTIQEFYEKLEIEQEQRKRDLVKKEFDIATNFGSRITRWEKVLDELNDRMVYVNCDTMEIRHPKTAICEKCDAIFVQSELKCDQCFAPRSGNNMKLYRPLGFKDITLE